MEGEDRGPGRLQRLPQQGGQLGQGGVELGLGDAELAHHDAVEALRVLADGGVAALLHVAEDLPHRLHGRDDVEVGAR